MKYADILQKHHNREEAEFEFLTHIMDRLERIERDLSDVVGDLDQAFMEKKAAYQKQKPDKAA